MKRFFAALLSFALCLALLLFIRSEPDEPILHVALKPAGEQDAAYVYETVYASGKSRACNAFTPDTCVFYTADYADFDTSALRSHRVNTLVATTLYDSVGNVVEPNETMIAMMHAAADQIDHAIFDFQIIVVNGQRYFAFIKLNVNWWDPCTLYEYEGGELLFLFHLFFSKLYGSRPAANSEIISAVRAMPLLTKVSCNSFRLTHAPSASSKLSRWMASSSPSSLHQ